jgi:ubiquitin C-terminal hydrolase
MWWVDDVEVKIPVLPEERFECCTIANDPPGTFVCLRCPKYVGFCLSHSAQHVQATGHVVFALVRPKREPSDVQFDPSGASYLRLGRCSHRRLRDFRRYDSYVFRVNSKAIRRPLVAGFFNLGNTCYFNSNLHVLFAIPEFVAFCLSGDCASANRLGFELVRGAHPQLINGRLRQALDADAPAFLLANPIDSVEFFNYALRTIRRYLPDCPLRLAEFETTRSIVCSSCGASVPIDDEIAVPALVIEPRAVGRKLQTDTIEEMIARACCIPRNTWACPQCGSAGGMCNRRIKVAPNYLFINNDLDYGTRVPDRRYKRSLVLEMDPDELHLAGVLAGGADPAYRLTAFMDHKGKWALWGHDISYVREGEHWIRFDDEDVRELRSLRGKVVFGQQYLYLFEKIV